MFEHIPWCEIHNCPAVNCGPSHRFDQVAANILKNATPPPAPPTMGILTRIDILELIAAGVIYYGIKSPRHTPLIALVNQTSMDVTLGREIICELENGSNIMLNRVGDPFNSVSTELPYVLNPNEFILGHTQQRFNLPNNISADFRLKSSVARGGLENLMAGWCDPGWHGSSLTLELKNSTRFHCIELTEGAKIGQMVFWRHAEVDPEHSYAKVGKYNNDVGAKGAK